MLFLFFYDEETLQKKEVENLWTVRASNAHISPKRVINLMQSHSTGGGANMIKMM